MAILASFQVKQCVTRLIVSKVSFCPRVEFYILCRELLCTLGFDDDMRVAKATSSLFLYKPSVWSLEQEQRLEEAILVCSCPFPSYQHEAFLCFGKRMWLQVKAPATQTPFDGWCLSVKDLCHNEVTSKFCVPSCSFAVTHGGIQACGGPEMRCKRDTDTKRGYFCHLSNFLLVTANLSAFFFLNISKCNFIHLQRLYLDVMCNDQVY